MCILLYNTGWALLLYLFQGFIEEMNPNADIIAITQVAWVLTLFLLALKNLAQN